MAVFPNLLTAVVKMDHMLSQCKSLDMHSVEMPLPMKRELISSKGKLLDSILAALYEIGFELDGIIIAIALELILNSHCTEQFPKGRIKTASGPHHFFSFICMLVYVVRWLNAVVRKKSLKMPYNNHHYL